MLTIKILNQFFKGSAMKRFAAFAIIGVAFSLSVILSCIGLMDGFEKSLKEGVRLFNGDLTITASHPYDLSMIEQELSQIGVTDFHHTSLFQMDGYALSQNSDGRGVLITGIDQKSYFEVAKKIPKFTISNGVVIGKELSILLGIKKDDPITLVITQNGRLPKTVSLQVSDIVEHGVYQQDLRVVYLSLSKLWELIGTTNVVNSSYLSSDLPPKKLMDLVEDKIGNRFNIRTSWSDYEQLFEAVRVEKGIISLVMEVIVLVAILNVIALILYIYEKRVTDLFLLQALGLSKRSLFRVWLILGLFIGTTSIILSWPMIALFNYLLSHGKLFKLPGEIYYLKSLSLSLSLVNYLLIYLSFFILLFFIMFLAYTRLSKKSMVEQLRYRFR